ncbi:MAG: DUF2505 domain-containing protein, partial [Nevskiales bacterium]
MKATHRSAYNKGSDTVIKMFTDKDYFQRKYELLGAKDIKLLDYAKDGDDFSVEFERKVPAQTQLPGFAKKFMPDLMTVTQRDSWDAATKTGRLDMSFQGVPGAGVSHMRLEDTDTGCDLVMEWEIICNV